MATHETKSKVILYIAVSLDGYIALPNGDISWLSEFEGGSEDYGYGKFFKRLGAAIMGAKTYEQVLGFGKWPYPGVTAYVITHRKWDNALQENIVFYNGDFKKLIEEAKRKTKKDIWIVGGSQIITGFMNQGLIDEYIISVIPIILTEGIPLFKNINRRKRLQAVDTKAYPSGIVQIKYKNLGKKRLQAGTSRKEF